MKKGIALIILLTAAVLLACGTAAADGQTNPRRKHVEKMKQWKSEKRIPGLFRSEAPSPEITVTCTKAPTLEEPGEFTVEVSNGGDYTDWRFEYGVTDRSRDPNGYIYYSKATDSSTFGDFVFCSAGEYELDVFLYRQEDMVNPVNRFTLGPITVEAAPGYPTLEEKAQEIVDECSAAGDDWQTALNLHDWLTRHTYYDLNYEYYGADVLFRGIGVCDSYSKAFKLLCNTAGITADRVTSNAQNHAWNAIRFGDTWYQVDVTWDDPSGGTAAISGEEHHAYFCLSDDVMFLDHTRYDVSFDPGCPSMEMNYYIRTDTWQAFGTYDADGDTVETFFLDALDGGDANPEMFLDDWEGYWTEDGYGGDMSGVRYEIYVTGLRRKDWTLDGDALKAEIELNHNDRFVSLDARWDVAETGTLILPPITKRVGDNAFEQTDATTVIIPEGCVKIGAEAFKDSGVRTMYVPATVTAVGDGAFDGCRRIIFILEAADSDFADYAREAGHLVAEP